MAIKVRLFAALAEGSGTREVDIAYRPQLTCAELWNEIKTRYPKLAPVRPLFAINDEYVAPETPLTDGESVLLFPPVSGG
jgi:molybdopterin synthase sulfur carrier subunit